MFCSEFHSNLNIFQFGEKYCDVNIIVQDRKFPCHRVVLAAASEYFEAMFGGWFRERYDQESTLRDIDVDTFENLMKFIYEGREIEIKVCNFFNLLHASLYLGIRSVEACCVKFILQNLSTLQDHIIDIYIFAYSSNMKDLSDILSQYMVKNFNYFYKDQRFHTMFHDNLKHFLDVWVQDNELLFKHENLLLDLLIRWVYYSLEERKKYFKQLVQIVNFERISMEYINFIVNYFKNLTEVCEFGQTSVITNVASIMKEDTTASDSLLIYPLDIQDQSNTVLLKRKIVEYFTINEQFMSSSSNKMPVPFVAPKFYKGELGLHVYVEYTKLFKSVGNERRYQSCESVYNIDDTPVGDLKHARIFSTNKYQPEWVFSGETIPWSRNIHRRVVSQEPFDLMYCLETLENGTNNLNNFQLSFCTYSSIDMSSVSNVLAQPPFSLRERSFDMGAAQYGIVVYSPDSSAGPNYQNVLHHYISEVNTWSNLPQPPIEYFQSALLAVEDNLVYLIGGGTHTQIVALDYRTPTWMELPSSNHPYYDDSKSCVLNGKLYVSKERTLEIFDPRALVWERIEMPKMRVAFLAAYENLLWVITKEDWYSPHDHLIAVYNPVSQNWHMDQLSMSEAIICYANKLRDPYMPAECDYHYDIKDVVVLKS